MVVSEPDEAMFNVQRSAPQAVTMCTRELIHDLFKHTIRRLLARIVQITLIILLIVSGMYYMHRLLRSGPPLNSYDLAYGNLNQTSEPARCAIATFLAGSAANLKEGGDPEDDPYYIATRVFAYQILHAPETRCNESVSFVVLVTSTVSERAKQQLRSDGAKVVEAEDVPLRWWIKTGVTRWKDQFTKLRLFEMIEYDRILLIDADTLLLSKIDGIFHEPEVQRPVRILSNRPQKTDESPLPDNFLFAARSDNALTGERNHTFPPLQTNSFSAGFFMIAPSPRLFHYLLSVMNHYRRFDPHTMEQSLLNYAFRRNGPMPWRELHYKWSATWPNLEDLEAGVVTLHEKFWSTGPPELQRLWRQQREAMERHFAKSAK